MSQLKLKPLTKKQDRSCSSQWHSLSPGLSGRLLLSFIFRTSNPPFIARRPLAPVHHSTETHTSSPDFPSAPICCTLCSAPNFPNKLNCCTFSAAAGVISTPFQVSGQVNHLLPMSNIFSTLFLRSLLNGNLSLVKRGFSKSAFRRGILCAINVFKTNAAK